MQMNEVIKKKFHRNVESYTVILLLPKACDKSKSCTVTSATSVVKQLSSIMFIK